jgi:FixJ family two-component response regulator
MPKADGVRYYSQECFFGKLLMKNLPVIAVVDDDAICRKMAEFVLQSSQMTPFCFDSAQAFLDWIQHNTCDCILLDINMPGTTGEELQGKLTDLKIDVPILFLTSEADVSVANALIHNGAVDVLLKPLDPQILLPRVCEAIESRLANQS